MERMEPMETALSTDVVTPMETALSTDVIMGVVLSNLKKKDLLNCRKVSKFWNKAASSVMRKRAAKMKNISDELDLMELEECMTKSWDFPFAGLVFDEPWTLSSAGAMEFFKNHGAKFTRLRLDTCWTIRLQDLAPFINLLPRLSILEVGWSDSRPPRVESLDSAPGQEDGNILELSSVRTIRFPEVIGIAKVNKDVLREICMAASPTLRIECIWATSKILRALKSVGKLQAVSVLNAAIQTQGHALNLLSTELPTLTKLTFSTGGCLSLEGLKKLLISSQHTLKELNLLGTYPSQFLSECPVLTKLTTLSLRIVGQSYEYVFQGRQGHKFPALKELELDTDNQIFDPSIGNLTDGLFIVPSLTKILLTGYLNQAGIEDLARGFPNVIEIRLNNFDCSPHSRLLDIWSVCGFKFLEKLRIWDYTVKRPTKKTINIDSFLTGIPIGICENLRKHNQPIFTDPPFSGILRDRASILQLTNLKELIVCVEPGYGLNELPEEPPFMSMVSVWYALQMMPHLEAKFVYDCRAPSWRFVEEEKAVTMLKAAFKHVKPYVELERFFY